MEVSHEIFIWNGPINFKNSGFREIKEFVYKNSIPKYLLSNPPKETLDFEGDIDVILQIIDKYMKEDD